MGAYAAQAAQARFASESLLPNVILTVLADGGGQQLGRLIAHGAPAHRP